MSNIIIDFNDNSMFYNKKAFTQYDYGQTIEIKGLDLAEGVKVHFARKGTVAKVVTPTILDGNATVNVPDDLLTYEGELLIYVYTYTETSGKTLKRIDFDIQKRELPEDYETPLELDLMSLTTEYIEENTPKDDVESRIASLEDAVNKLILQGLGVL